MNNIKIRIYFSDIFDVNPKIIENYGAFNISLISDLPMFIDPFLIFANNQKYVYKKLHNQILEYLSFLKKKSDEGITSKGMIMNWYAFPEVKQNWLGYCKMGNTGKGLGWSFASPISQIMGKVFPSIGNEIITKTTHIEELSLFKPGIGRDFVSDFTTNIIFDYLLRYTETFAKNYLTAGQCSNFRLNAVFDYEKEDWVPALYYLPKFNNDFVVLTPKEILTRDETWINSHDMIDKFQDVVSSIENEILRAKIQNVYQNSLPRLEASKLTDAQVKAAKWCAINQVPELIYYYVKLKEEDTDGAITSAKDKIKQVENMYVSNIAHFVSNELNPAFYDIPSNCAYNEALKRVAYLKKVIENNDAYKIFYDKGKFIAKEESLQLIFRLVWYGSKYDVNREVNNGRGPVDYKISNGAKDKALVEFKLASNTQLKKNLQNQLGIYLKANNTNKGIICILYFNKKEKQRTENILKELNLQNCENIVTIDAMIKVSASKADGQM